VPEEAINRIERETGGRVLSVQRFQRGGRDVNRIKVYTPEGRVRVMWDYNGRATRVEPPRRGDQLLIPSPPRYEREPVPASRYEREPRPAAGYERDPAPALRLEREPPRGRDER
jgi:hypothetical protein